MKRRLSIILTLLLLCNAALANAEAPQISGSLFSNAKQALVYLASGEYERLVTLLPFSGVAPSATEWQNFADGNFHSLQSVQTDYAVAYWMDDVWKVAVPLSEPTDGSVEVFVLISPDGSTFSGYRYCNWHTVCSEYECASYVTWNSEYIPANPHIAID